MGEGQGCYIDELTSTYADNMGTQVQQEEAETAALEQAVTRFLQIGHIRYGFSGTDKFSMEDLNHFIYDDEEMGAADEAAQRITRQSFGYLDGSPEQDALHSQATQMQSDLTYRAAIAMLKPHVGYFMDLDAIAA